MILVNIKENFPCKNADRLINLKAEVHLSLEETNDIGEEIEEFCLSFAF
jgi:hypothetical protein